MTRFADFFSTTLCQIGVPLLCKVLRKMTLKNGEIWKINFRFCQNFTPHYLKTSYGEGTPCSYRVVGKKSETLGMCIGVRFGFVLGEFCPFKENEYRSEHLVGIFGNFWEFLSLHWGTILFNSIQNTEIRVPGAQIHYFTTLMCFCKNQKFWVATLKIFWSKSQISPFFKLTFLQTFYSDLPQTYTILVEKKSANPAIFMGGWFDSVLRQFCPFEKNEYRSEIPVGIFWEFFWQNFPQNLKILIKTSKSHSNFWFWDSNDFFWSEIFDPLFLKTSHGEGTSLSYRDVEKKSETLPIFFGVRFGFVLTEFLPFEKSEYRSEVLVSTFRNFFLRFFELPKSSLKNSKKGPRGPNTSFYDSNVLMEKMKNFDIMESWRVFFAIFLHWLIKEICID